MAILRVHCRRACRRGAPSPKGCPHEDSINSSADVQPRHVLLPECKASARLLSQGDACMAGTAAQRTSTSASLRSRIEE